MLSGWQINSTVNLPSRTISLRRVAYSPTGPRANASYSAALLLSSPSIARSLEEPLVSRNFLFSNQRNLTSNHRIHNHRARFSLRAKFNRPRNAPLSPSVSLIQSILSFPLVDLKVDHFIPICAA